MGYINHSVKNDDIVTVKPRMEIAGIIIINYNVSSLSNDMRRTWIISTYSILTFS